jgi:ABC-2 type transport system permease protein
MTLATPTTRAGFRRGLIELRQAFTGTALLGQLFWPVATLTAVYFLRDRPVGAGGFTLGGMMLPGVLGMFVALGMLLVVQQLAADREDGTLLRAKATPNGIPAYLVGKLVQISATVLAYLAILLIPGVFLVDGLTLDSWRSWLTFAWVVVLGLVATQTIGAILGSLVSSQRGAGHLSLPILGLIAISGIFAPITALPAWLQGIAQVFPIYWLGLGMRSAFLPEDAAAIEIGESWRQLETAAVLGAWAVAGLALAPIVLRRMARRESGSSVAKRREKAMRRVG